MDLMLANFSGGFFISKKMWVTIYSARVEAKDEISKKSNPLVVAAL